MATNSDTSQTKVGINKEQLKQWQQEQEKICGKIVLFDTEQWQVKRKKAEKTGSSSFVEKTDVGIAVSVSPKLNFQSFKDLTDEYKTPLPLKFAGGFDISYLKGGTTACAALVVCELPDLEVVYEELIMVEITTPYVAGFLCFRETSPLLIAFDHLKEQNPYFMPQVLLVDGNGYLHDRGSGLACYAGVKLDMPTVGVSKNLFHMENIERDDKHKEQILHLKNVGDKFPLFTKDGMIIGMALKTHEKAQKPVYVSIGHRISIDTATWVVQICSKYRIPEPIRQADIRSRQFLRERFPEFCSDAEQQQRNEGSFPNEIATSDKLS